MRTAGVAAVACSVVAPGVAVLSGWPQASACGVVRAVVASPPQRTLYACAGYPALTLVRWDLWVRAPHLHFMAITPGRFRCSDPGWVRTVLHASAAGRSVPSGAWEFVDLAPRGAVVVVESSSRPHSLSRFVGPVHGQTVIDVSVPIETHMPCSVTSSSV